VGAQNSTEEWANVGGVVDERATVFVMERRSGAPANFASREAHSFDFTLDGDCD
jgi:hypothetical protein